MVFLYLFAFIRVKPSVKLARIKKSFERLNQIYMDTDTKQKQCFEEISLDVVTLCIMSLVFEAEIFLYI